MMLSLFLAKLIGVYMLIVALIALVRKNHFLEAVTSMIMSKSTLAFSGVFALLAGIAILLSHPVWEWNWRGLISLIAVLAIIQGILRLGFTAEIQHHFSVEKIRRGYWVIVIVLVVVGLYLTYNGFNH